IRPYWWNKGIDDEVLFKKDSNEATLTNTSLYMRNNFIRFHTKIIAVIADDAILNHHPPNKIKVDYLILSQNAKVKIPELLAVFDVHQIIFDSSNSIYHCNKWEEDCKRNAIKFH